MFIPRRFAPPLSKGEGCRTTCRHHAANLAATDADKDPQLMQTKTRSRDLPFSKGPGVCRSHVHHAASHAATDADKSPQPRPPLFKGAGGMQKPCPPCCKPRRNRRRQRPATATSPFQRGRGYAEVMSTMLQTMPQPMQTKTRSRDLPFSKGPGVCKSLAHHAASHATTNAGKDPQPRPPLFKGAGGM